eukprot:Gb_06684 [translate_table: standard]
MDIAQISYDQSCGYRSPLTSQKEQEMTLGSDGITDFVTYVIFYFGVKRLRQQKKEDEANEVDIVAMVNYLRETDDPAKVCKARGSNLRVHFKNTREATQAIKKLYLAKAKRYLEDVLAHKKEIPLCHFYGAVGGTVQAKS